MSASSIEIRGLQALGRHGVLPEEQARAQPFEVDITIETHLAPAARTDDLESTVDYSTVIAAVVQIIETRQFALLETLASTIAENVLGRRGVEAVTVEVRKMRPPVAAQVAWVGVR
ncbi:MAG TPA: dihydroneopterin aldolase, partial [Acidimicrobiales bacterium]|nr:dihydroneopterin aldolase [Acidimicrobiales bacterium]